MSWAQSYFVSIYMYIYSAGKLDVAALLPVVTVDCWEHIKAQRKFNTLFTFYQE
jgi:hypothetical protein